MSIELPHLKDIPTLRGKRILLRASFNVPIENSSVADDYRLKRSLTTIKYLREHGARTIIVGHIGRGESNTIKPVCDWLRERMPVRFAETIEEAKRLSADMKEGELILLENLRKDSREVGNDESFARELSSMADLYVNDAFDAAHREHSSVVGVPNYIPSYAGFLFCEEVENLERSLSPSSPSLFMLAGAKFDTKEPLIRKFLNIYDKVFIGGALANDFFTARGWNVGQSFVSENAHLSDEILNNEKIVLPVDVTVEKEKEGGNTIKLPSAVMDGERIVDCGPTTLNNLLALVGEADTILWNGPLGEYEKGYEEYSIKLAEGIAESKATSIVGGGDTLAVISKLGITDKFSFVSTGGGAMLEFLAKGTLPGIEALMNSHA